MEKQVWKNQILVWKFEVDEYDIEFQVAWKKEDDNENDEIMESLDVHRKARYAASILTPIEGMFTCTKDGSIVLSWDNSYSLVRG